MCFLGYLTINGQGVIEYLKTWGSSVCLEWVILSYCQVLKHNEISPSFKKSILKAKFPQWPFKRNDVIFTRGSFIFNKHVIFLLLLLYSSPNCSMSPLSVYPPIVSGLSGLMLSHGPLLFLLLLLHLCCVTEEQVAPLPGDPAGST